MTSDELADGVREPRRVWKRVVIGVLVVLAWTSIFAWQRERSRNESALRQNKVAADEYVAAQKLHAAAQARLDDVNHLINIALLKDGQDADLRALSVAMHSLQGDLQADVAWYSDIVDVLEQHDFTKYNQMLGPANTIDSSWTRDLLEVNRLHQELGLSS